MVAHVSVTHATETGLADQYLGINISIRFIGHTGLDFTPSACMPRVRLLGARRKARSNHSYRKNGGHRMKGSCTRTMNTSSRAVVPCREYVCTQIVAFRPYNLRRMQLLLGAGLSSPTRGK